MIKTHLTPVATVRKIEIDKAGYLLLQNECTIKRIGKPLSEKRLNELDIYYKRCWGTGYKEYWDKDLGFTCEEAIELLKANNLYYKDLGTDTECDISFSL